MKEQYRLVIATDLKNGLFETDSELMKVLVKYAEDNMDETIRLLDLGDKAPDGFQSCSVDFDNNQVICHADVLVDKRKVNDREEFLEKYGDEFKPVVRYAKIGGYQMSVDIKLAKSFIKAKEDYENRIDIIQGKKSVNEMPEIMQIFSQGCGGIGFTDIKNIDSNPNFAKAMKKWCNNNEDKCFYHDSNYGGDTVSLKLQSNSKYDQCIAPKEASHEVFLEELRNMGIDTGKAYVYSRLDQGDKMDVGGKERGRYFQVCVYEDVDAEVSIPKYCHPITRKKRKALREAKKEWRTGHWEAVEVDYWEKDKVGAEPQGYIWEMMKGYDKPLTDGAKIV